MQKDDLFPRSFIVSLDPPSNYFGPEKVFFEDSETVLQEINDNEDLLPLKHRKDHEVVELPRESLQAVRTFVRREGDSAGARARQRSLLDAGQRLAIHGCTEAAAQRDPRSSCDESRTVFASTPALPPESALRDPEMRALHDVWLAQYSAAEFDWELVQTRLLEAVAPIRVVEVNSARRGLSTTRRTRRTVSV